MDRPKVGHTGVFCTNLIEWASSEPHLLATVGFFYSRNRVLGAAASVMLNRQSPSFVSREDTKRLAAALKQFNTTLKAGEASVLEWTNTPYGVYPLKFECRVYDSLFEQLDYYEKAGGYRAGHVPALRIKHTVTITSIGESAPVTFPPMLSTPTWMVDNRFRDNRRQVQRIEYGPLTNWILDPRDVMARAAGHFPVMTIKMSAEQQVPWLRWPLIILLIALVAFPLLALRLRKGAKK